MVSHLSHGYQQADGVTLLKVHNIYPITFSIVTFFLGLIVQFYIYQGRIEVMAQKQALIDIEINDLSHEYGTLSAACQSKIVVTPSVMGVSTSSAKGGER